MSYQKNAYRLKILLNDLKLNTSIAPRTDVPYSSNASAALWLGVNFPHHLAVKTIMLARNYYTDLRYIALSDKQSSPPDEVHYQLYLGGSTETALREGLRAWSEKDFDKLKKVKSTPELHKLIRDKYGKP